MSTEIAIRGYHLDAYMHVNNARYLEFMEEARWQFLDLNNAKEYFQSRGLAFIIVNINISYKYPITQGQTLLIESIPSKKGNTSWFFKQIGKVKGSDKIVFDAEVTFVFVDSKTGKPVRLTEEMEKVMIPD